MNRGRLSNLDIGESVGGTNWLAERWNWTRKTVRGFLDLLEQEAMIERVLGAAKGEIDTELNGNQKGHRGGHQANVIRVCNYSAYQVGADASGPPLGPVEGHHRATTGPQYKKERRKEDRVPGGEVGDGGVGEELLPSPVGSGPPPEPAVTQVANKPAKKKPPEGMGTRLPKDWTLPEAWRDWALEDRDVTETIIAEQAVAFKDFWLAKAGQDARKVDWLATWRRWMRQDFRPRKQAQAEAPPPALPWWKDPKRRAAVSLDRWREGIAKHANGVWNIAMLGPPPGDEECVVPRQIIDEMKLEERYTPDGIARQRH
jgi:hypothetical protein